MSRLVTLSWKLVLSAVHHTPSVTVVQPVSLSELNELARKKYELQQNTTYNVPKSSPALTRLVS